MALRLILTEALLKGVGGLNDKKVKSDSTATFTIQGSIHPNMDSIASINWYRIDPPSTGNSDKPRLVATGKSLQFSVSNTKLKTDNGAYYYAVVTFNGKSTKQITTNKALLSVYSLQNNEIKFSSFSVKNETNSDVQNTRVLLNNVKNYDKITMNFWLRDSLLGSHDKGPLVIQLPAGAVVTEARSTSNSSQFDSYTDPMGKKVFKTQATDDPNIETLTDKNSEFDGFGAMLYTVSFYLTKAELNSNFKGTMTYSPVSATGVEYGTYVGPSYSINPIPPEFQLSARSIDFGNILPSSNKALIGKINDPNYMILKVTDLRTPEKRSPRELSVSADSNFINENGKIFHTSLVLDNNGVEKPIDLAGIQIYETKTGEEMPSVYWKNKLKLRFLSQPQNGGVYKTKLTWTITDSR
ncbi:hypothetical protein [Companilactobacillus zhongbaensis]|uniref:hypothetical protein n=1 Tax=Companilactobacillus zhongbaensis TaxID=2486009 RepID=UPI000F78D1A4|nr:hypothetical protein [Companilactobacillus zhongbaensis]